MHCVCTIILDMPLLIIQILNLILYSIKAGRFAYYHKFCKVYILDIRLFKKLRLLVLTQSFPYQKQPKEYVAKKIIFAWEYVYLDAL